HPAGHRRRGAADVRPGARRVRGGRRRLGKSGGEDPDRAGPDLPAGQPVPPGAGRRRGHPALRALVPPRPGHRASGQPTEGPGVSAVQPAPAPSALGRRWSRIALIAIAAVYVGVLLVAPLASIAWTVVKGGAHVVSQTFRAPDVRHAFLLTLVITVLTVTV